MSKKNKKPACFPAPEPEQYRVALIETGPHHITEARHERDCRATFRDWGKSVEREIFTTDDLAIVALMKIVSDRETEIARLRNIIKQYVDASSKVTQEGSKQ